MGHSGKLFTDFAFAFYRFYLVGRKWSYYSAVRTYDIENFFQYSMFSEQCYFET